MTDTNLRWIPRFIYGDSELQLTYPVTRWDVGARTVGSVAKTVTGIPGPVLQLRKYTLTTSLRFTEEQWPSVSAWIQFAQTGQSFFWYPQDIDTDTPEFFEVILTSPRLSDPVKPTRDSNILRMFALTVVFEMSVGWDLQYFRDGALPIGHGAFNSTAFNNDAFAT